VSLTTFMVLHSNHYGRKLHLCMQLTIRFLSPSHPRTAAYLVAANAWAMATFIRCNAASAASSVAALLDSAGDLTACYISNVLDDATAGPACIAAETRTMLAAYPAIAAVRAACIDAGSPSPPEPPTARTGESLTCLAALTHMMTTDLNLSAFVLV